VREVEPNIFVLNPLAVPLYGPKGRSLNRRLLRMQIRGAMRRLGFRRPINWVFNPAAAVVAGELNEDQVIYYCVDEYTAFAGVNSSSLAELERKVLKLADLVVVSAERLYDAKSPMNPRTVLIRHGVDYDHFRKALDPATKVPDEIAKLPRPVIGYFGLMSDDWFDVGLMEQVAKRFSHGSVVLLGKVTMDLSRLTRLPNVHWLGRKPYGELPAYSRGFDVAVIPFPISEVTLAANPLKAREYLAAGLPVVSTDIPEVRALGDLCRVGTNAEEFVRQIELALREPGPSAARSERVRDQSWQAKLDELREHLAGLPEGEK
jgi:glycosyltransferase involved in cell wall biosynthesis